MTRISRILFFFATVLASAWFAYATPVFAQIDTAGLRAVGEATQLSAVDPRVIAVRIINIALGFLAIIMVSLILYAGFLWMTAGGSQEQVAKAEQYIRNAIIGLIIILSSWAIARFVITRLLGATRDGGGGSTIGTGTGGLGGFGSSAGASAFQLRSINPQGDVRIRNVEVRFLFTREADPASVTTQIRVVRASDGVNVDGEFAVEGTLVTFRPSATCPPPSADRRCFEANREFEARVGGSLRSIAGQTIVCGGFAPVCRTRFTTGSVVDTQLPSIEVIYPISGQNIPVNDLVRVLSRVSDDGGVSHVQTLVDGALVGSDAPIATTSSPLVFDAHVPWNTTGLSLGIHTIKSEAFDVDSNRQVSLGVTVMARPGHCFNTVQDADETGLNCGGSCGACAGSSCTPGGSMSSMTCASGMCSAAGRCVEQPIITDVAPRDGAPGTFVTISGTNFGSSPGTVRFTSGRIASAPAACSSLGRLWSPTHVIVEVPTGAVSGPVEITNASSSLTDVTNNTLGPRIDDFVVNTSTHPGLCFLEPGHGEVGTRVMLYGKSFGSPNRVFFSDREVTSFEFWSDPQIALRVPVFSAGRYSARVKTTGNDFTNPVDFVIDERVITALPIIESVTPDNGPVGEYLMIEGRNFGDQTGQVIFSNETAEGPASVEFPALCSNQYWRNHRVVVKIPATVGSSPITQSLRPGQRYRVYLRRHDRAVSNAILVSIVSGSPRPGICALQPDVGPIDTPVKVLGEGFGASIGSVNFSGFVTTTRIDAVIDAGGWGVNEIKTRVPRGSHSGPVIMRANGRDSNPVTFFVKNCQENASICRSGETCCRSGACSVGGVCAMTSVEAQYAWRTSTGPIPLNPEVVEECSLSDTPSPTPWGRRPGGNRACLNADVVMRFNTHINPATVTSRNILVRECTGSGENPCATARDVAPRAGFPALHDQTNDSYILFRPGGTTNRWAVSTTYEVILRTGIQSMDNYPMLENAQRCGAGNAYCFRFQTRHEGEDCRVGAVTISPGEHTASDLGERIGYRSQPRASDDICLILDGSAYDWRWFIGESPTSPDGRAALMTPLALGDRGRISDVQTVVTIADTGTRPTRVNAEMMNPGDAAPTRGTGFLKIRPTPPRVVAYGPNCEQACLNAAIWARFNVAMAPDSGTLRNVILKRCTNENCREFDEVSDPPAGDVFFRNATGGTDGTITDLVVEPFRTVAGRRDPVLQAGRYYQVTLRGGAGGFRSRSNLFLTGLTDPDGFSWKFRVKTGENARCAVARVDVVPEEKIQTVVLSRQLFSAQPVSAPDACHERGQPLISDRTYAWSVADAQVAQLINAAGRPGILSLSGELPALCSTQCLNMGSTGVVGRTASCGNELIETTDKAYCYRTTAPACPVGSRDCVLRFSGVPCASGTADCIRRIACRVGQTECATRFGDRCLLLSPDARGGEECDLGTGNGSTGLCGLQCLWNPRSVSTPSVVDSTCGNGIVDRGEQCDPGRTCVGGSLAGRLCTGDADCGAGGTCRATDRNGCSSRCQLQGSRLGGSTCGNVDLADGEACDDGNTNDGDGCSSDCLHEGSSRVTALCGNTIPESGESCEAARQPDGTLRWSEGCDHETCLRTGTNTCPAWSPAIVPATPPPTNCCGNGLLVGRTAPEPGEDCDDGNTTAGDGCSPRCLFEGSSVGYRLPSFCGDGERGTGEQCEAAGSGVTFQASRQLVEITGRREPDTSGRMQTDVQTRYDNKDGRAMYGLQCGFVQETSCPAGTGLTDRGCCMARPRILSHYPEANAENVCRNAQISALFDSELKVNSLTSSTALLAWQALTCPEGSISLDRFPVAEHSWRTRFVEWWKRLFSMLIGREALAQAETMTWCVSLTEVRVTTQKVGESQMRATFMSQHALLSNTVYRVFFRGDSDLTDDRRQGIKNIRGVTLHPDATWTFTTGARICAANEITVRDLHIEHPYLFSTRNESAHAFTAAVDSIQNGVRVPLMSVAEYEWRWQPWTVSRPTILRVTNATAPDPTASVSSFDRNGRSFVNAGILITRDDANIPSTVNTTINSGKQVMVMLCERPWPAADTRAGYAGTSEFTDAPDSPILRGTPFATGPFYQFSTSYCLDAGESHRATDDLTSMTVRTVPARPSDSAQEILRQYLFTFEDASLRGDGIGLRILANNNHLSPEAWYRSRAFTGTPQSTIVDGYEAVRDGTTVYIAGTVLGRGTRSEVGHGTSDMLNTRMFVLSHNPDAKPQTVNIFNQLLENWSFNINADALTRNVCVDNRGVMPDNRVIPCTADWECIPTSTRVTANYHCAGFKPKLQRDLQRIVDFQEMTNALETTKQSQGTYPQLMNGTYMQSIAVSRWNSWQSAFGAAIGLSDAPVDPVGKFLTCGRCRLSDQSDRSSNTVCTEDGDCEANEHCQAQEGFDPATCWNVVSRRYLCPRLDESTPSHVYQYRALSIGERYELSTELEALGPASYEPPLAEEISRCSNTGQICQTNMDCTIRNPDGSFSTRTGECRATGGRWIYQRMCTGVPFGIDDVCGNGVRGRNEICELTDSRPLACRMPDGREGTKMQTCRQCQEFIDGPSTHCVADSTCGNGRIDRYKCYGGAGYRFGQACSILGSMTECSDPRDPSGLRMECASVSTVGRGTEEVCDDGAMNGTYGHCDRTCTGYGASCGDGLLSVGESCDNGPARTSPTQPLGNGDYCDTGNASCSVATSCSLDCRGQASHCGDGRIDEPFEECDGGRQETPSAVCVGGTNLASIPCRTDADCGRGTRCAPAGDIHGSCGGVTRGRCTDTGLNCGREGDPPCSLPGRCVQYATRHVRQCNNPGSTAAGGTSTQCRWATWSGCVGTGSCGDGRQDPGEECDDANRNDNDACTNQCKTNRCGDGLINVGVEQCDLGSENGRTCTSADYGSTCTGCSLTCRQVAASGGFCGDRIRNGTELCDGTDGIASNLACQSLGFDYAERSRCRVDRYTIDNQPGEENDRMVCKGMACSCDDYNYFVLTRRGMTARITELDFETSVMTAGRYRLLDDGNDGNTLLTSNTCKLFTETAETVPITSDKGTYMCMREGDPISGTPIVQDTIQCTSACSFSGCRRCQDSPGTGEISARVFDAVYADKNVPNARVTLYYRGTRIAEQYTDEQGQFTFRNLNNRSECGFYRIIIDSYVNNPQTGLYNEGTYGGYWPFETPIFNLTNFYTVGIQSNSTDRRIFMVPRVGPNETLVVHTWNGSLLSRYIDAHLVLPEALRFSISFLDPVYRSSPSGWRDIKYGELTQGNANLEVFPHARLYCFHPPVSGVTVVSEDCNNFNDAPEATKFKRTNDALTGKYSYYLVDFYGSSDARDSGNFFRQKNSMVRIVTQDQVYYARPPSTTPTCSDPTRSRGQYWLVFQQDALSGAITIPNGTTGQFMCTGDPMPGEGVSLPGLLMNAYSGSGS